MALRARQLERRDEDLKEAALHLRRMREQNKELFDDKHQLRRIPLDVGDLMLRHDTKLDNRHDLKLAFRWNGPFRVREADPVKGTYVLEEMDGARLDETYAGNRLKRFRTREVRAENAEEGETGLARPLGGTGEPEGMTEIAEKGFGEDFEMGEGDPGQIEELGEDRRDAQNSSRNAAESTDGENEALGDNAMATSLSYNVAGDAAAAARTGNGTLRDTALRQNFRNGHMREGASGEDTGFSTE